VPRKTKAQQLQEIREENDFINNVMLAFLPKRIQVRVLK
jgi:hypothetical protein